MPRGHLSIHRIREVLPLRFEQRLSYRAIASSCQIGVGAVQDYLARASAAGLSWPLPADIAPDEIDSLLFPAVAEGDSGSTEHAPDWNAVAQELRRKGMTLTLLWDEYIAQHPQGGIGYSQYCRLFRQYKQTIDPRMRQIHRSTSRAKSSSWTTPDRRFRLSTG